jgi:hypothetical protein
VARAAEEHNHPAVETDGAGMEDEEPALVEEEREHRPYQMEA